MLDRKRFVLVMLLSSVIMSAGDTPTGPIFRKERLPFGTQVFDQFNQDKRVGSMTLSVEKKGEKLVITDVTSVPTFNIEETIISELSPEDFAPISSVGRGHFGERPLNVSLTWNGDRVSGRLLSPSTDTRLDRVLTPANTVERTAIFALLPSLPLAADTSYKLNQFSTFDGKVRELTIEVTGKQVLSWGNGEHSTWRVELRGGMASQAFYITTDRPYRTLRIDVIDTAWSYTLAPPPGP